MAIAQLRIRLAALVLIVIAATAACGADRLPGFAKPPPYDGGAAGGAPADEDAG
jgi:hypothetical protein